MQILLFFVVVVIIIIFRVPSLQHSAASHVRQWSRSGHEMEWCRTATATFFHVLSPKKTFCTATS